MEKIKIGVIGGTGLYDIKGLEEIKEAKLSTPFGKPSDTIITGNLEGKRVAFLPRHAKGHRIMPTELNNKANIYALKSLGVEWIIAFSAVGSMKEEIRPQDFLIPDQLFDRTKTRVPTFFGKGIVAHISFADPYCPLLSKIIYDTGTDLGYRIHKDGTYLCIEGPQFSTRAESRIYRSWGVEVIGMTNLPEVKLAREAEICYSTIALVTDYDVWHVTEEVNVKTVMKNLEANALKAKELIKAVIPRIPDKRECPCATALANAIITQKEVIPEKRKKELELLVGKYLK
ncbi:MAG TPA: S-methyl-5'-thioadenosine phosphorylase [bacterium]|nr:S-methyl-5'-thioadenosine phosphorylase [bacterium]